MAKMMNNDDDAGSVSWLSDNVKRLASLSKETQRIAAYDDVREELLEDLSRSPKKGKLQSAYGLIVVGLRTLAIESMTKGSLRVINNGPDGWVDLRRGFLYDSLAAKFRHTFMLIDNCYDQPRNPLSASLFEGKEALTLCHAIATGDLSFACGFGNLLIDKFERMNKGDKLYFYSAKLFPFVLKLISIWMDRKIEFRADVADPCGKYQAIFDAWNDPQSMINAIFNLCELHCKESESSDAFASFSIPPYPIFPVEILAVIKIRQLLGFETCQVQHPILQSSLSFPPKSPPTITDEFLEKAKNRLLSDSPNAKFIW